jgi:hypothetical protein
MESVGFFISLHPGFHVPGSSIALIIAIKPTAKCRFRAAAMLFYILRNISVVDVGLGGGAGAPPPRPQRPHGRPAGQRQ